MRSAVTEKGPARRAARHLVHDTAVEHRFVRRSIRSETRRGGHVEPDRPSSDGGCRQPTGGRPWGARLAPAACSSRARTTRRRSCGCTATAAAGSAAKSRACAASAPSPRRAPRTWRGRRPAPAAAAACRRAPRAGRGRCRRTTTGVRPRARTSSTAAWASRAYSRNGARVIRPPHRHQVMRRAGDLGGLRLVRQDRQAAVELHRVARDDLAADPLGQLERDRALARRRRRRRWPRPPTAGL